MNPTYVIITIAVLGVICALVKHVKSFNEVKKHNSKFGVNSLTRIVAKNSGNGDVYLPQFLDRDGNWEYFLELDQGMITSDVVTVNRYSTDRCCDFIKNKKAEVSPTLEVVKEDCK